MPERSVRVAIIGGGYAGMSAAVELCDAGIRPHVLEAATTLGGRARRVEFDGRRLDNGLHILIGAYRETLRMVDRVRVGPASTGLLRLPLDLRIEGRFRLRASRMPAPLNVLSGLIRAQGLDAADKWAIARMMISLRLSNYTVSRDLPVAAYMTTQKQTPRARQWLWDPLCIAALNTSPEEASTRTFAAVLRDTFAAPASNCDLLLPTCDFSSLFPEPAATVTEKCGGSVRLGIRVTSVRDCGDQVRIATRDGDESYDAAIIAVAPQHVATLGADEPGLARAIDTLGRFDYRPIHSVYFGYPPSVRLPSPMIGVAGRYAQWVFDRGQLGGDAGTLGVVISAGGAHAQLPLDDLAAAVHAELAATFPDLPAPLWHRVIVEKRATFASKVDLVRPPARTGAPRLFLAGDYVDSAYPATLEAAVRSGIDAARLVARTLQLKS